MPPDLAFWLALPLKMAVAAAFVVTASLVAERAGPVIGALVATLPISAGPAYFFLALDHEPAFIAQGAVASLVVNAATGLFAVAFCAIAQSRPFVVSLPVSLGLWAAAIFLAHRIEWSLPGALVLNIGTYVVCLWLGRRFRDAPMPLVTRRWYDVPMRAAMVACLVATVVGVSTRVGATMTGILATFPIVLTSLIIIFQPRIGGPATAAIIANTLPGLIGFGAAVVTLALAAVPLGSAVALALALGVSIGWNLMLWLAGRRKMATVKGPSRP